MANPAKKRRKAGKSSAESDPMLDTSPQAMTRAKNNRLDLLLSRIENIGDEIKGMQDDRKDVFQELKAVGYDAKMAREMLKLRKMNPDDLTVYETTRDLYKAELGIE